MTKKELFEQIKKKQSMLCVGLDPDIDKIPKHLFEEQDPIFEFNKAIIDATLPYAVAYKPNIAFYEAYGIKGWNALRKTVEYLPDDVFKIADAKRGDIGNTSKKYAQAFFEQLPFDAITVSPYMGKDSVTPFMGQKDKWVIILAATSNEGSYDFQDLMVENTSEKLFERVITTSSAWGSDENTMYVIGATRVQTLVKVRTIVPNHILLIPGVGAQGGDLNQVCKFGLSKKGALLINAARSIIYAGNKKDFAEHAEKAAADLQKQMSQILIEKGIIE